jgi:hypothetical protein
MEILFSVIVAILLLGVVSFILFLILGLILPFIKEPKFGIAFIVTVLVIAYFIYWGSV